MTSRRSFITGLIALVAAPAIVRAGSLMPIKAEIIIPPLRQFVVTGILPGRTALYGGSAGISEILGDWRSHLNVGDIVTFAGIRMER